MLTDAMRLAEEPAVDEPEELVEAPVEDVTATFVGAET